MKYFFFLKWSHNIAVDLKLSWFCSDVQEQIGHQSKRVRFWAYLLFYVKVDRFPKYLQALVIYSGREHTYILFLNVWIILFSSYSTVYCYALELCIVHCHLLVTSEIVYLYVVIIYCSQQCWCATCYWFLWPRLWTGGNVNTGHNWPPCQNLDVPDLDAHVCLLPRHTHTHI